MDYMLGEIACIKETYMFYGNRIINDRISPLSWTLTCEITPVASVDDNVLNKSVIAYEKIKFWLDNVLNDVTFAIQSSELGSTLCYLSENPTMLTPYMPTDNHILQLIHCKISAIAGKDLHIGLSTLDSVDSSSMCIYNTESYHYNLPTTDKTGVENMYHSKPWWRRGTFDFADYSKEEVAEHELLREYVENGDPMAIFETELISMYSDKKGKKTAKAEIIKMPKKWSPKIL